MSSLPPRKYRTFLTDEDGLNSRDYLLLLSTSIFFLFISIGLVLVLLDKSIDGMYLSLLDMVSPVVMTIVGSVAGIDITDKITTSRRKKKEQKIKVVQQEEYQSDEHESNVDNSYEQDYINDIPNDMSSDSSFK